MSTNRIRRRWRHAPGHIIVRPPRGSTCRTQFVSGSSVPQRFQRPSRLPNSRKSRKNRWSQLVDATGILRMRWHRRETIIQGLEHGQGRTNRTRPDEKPPRLSLKALVCFFRLCRFLSGVVRVHYGGCLLQTDTDARGLAPAFIHQKSIPRAEISHRGIDQLRRSLFGLVGSEVGTRADEPGLTQIRQKVGNATKAHRFV